MPTSWCQVNATTCLGVFVVQPQQLLMLLERRWSWVGDGSSCTAVAELGCPVSAQVVEPSLAVVRFMLYKVWRMKLTLVMQFKSLVPHLGCQTQLKHQTDSIGLLLR